MFRTELPLTPYPQQLPLSARALTIGSCFSDSIGSRLAADKVTTLVNPFGTVFNPLAACRLLRAAAGEDTDWQQHVVEARGRWQSLDLHSSVGAESPVELLQQVQQLLRDTGVFVATADVVVLTLGSAWVYRYKETGELVSNCHKLPAEKFDKELLTPDEIINAVAETHAFLRLRNPKLRFVLTVSPVRHIKDTLPLNAVSKSVLRVAAHYLSELLPDVSYFPAYELLLDDLRDYRFYAEDMLHPSKVAEDYIWERFARTYFDAGFGRFRKEWDTVRQALSHRPLYPAAPEHRQFLESTLERLERLSAQADVRMEILEVRHQLQNLPLPAPKPEPEPEEEDDEERIDIGEHAAPVQPTATAAVVAEESEEEPEEFEEFESVRNDAEPAYLAADAAEADGTAETETAEILDALAPAKKKRRSRGGAKRNKKKHAARLAAEAATPTGTETGPVGNEQPETVEQLAPTVGTAALPAVPAVSIIADPTMPPQTAMERRKRGSRRGRGRGRNAGHEVPTTESALTTLPLESSETTPAEPAPAPAAEASLRPESAVTADLSADVVSLSEETGTSQRPARTGRSASEKRADALRKPHRSGSRIRPLYAGDEQAVNSQAATPAGTTESASLPQPSIPVTTGTGASGRLTEAGKATRSARSAAPVAPARPPVATPAPAGSVAEVVPVVPAAPVVEIPAVVAAPAATPDAAVASPASAASAKPRRKPARKPAASAPEAVPNATSEATPETAPTIAPPPAVPVTKAAARAPRKPRATPAPQLETPAATSTTPAKRRSKPAAATVPAEKPAPPAKAGSKKSFAKAPADKQAARPARSKPTKPDAPAENQ